ncbi:hypothetical protein MIMGU_mgv1a021331mg [Erythranthe guttata]|uniref:C2H2-type domain-containing protein n=2 Tax=Erythranthe guttata TaxID=4155 RepID=A0A022RBE3_ERYGU|nr:hypothetical protein MIMGU_mgv1a021331mg [Erythranthe guttata]
MEISEDFSGCTNVHQIIVKGKRAKRPRPSSSASSAAAAGEFINNSNSLVSSPATSSSVISTSTEEDEDMANCLILLAQGGGGGGTEGKFSSRRFPEMTAATAAEGKVGVYVYECKTCSRTFPSFQALGGHRASHKKPKPSAAAADVDRKRPPPPAAAPIDQTAEYAPAAPSTQFPKTHECSICGSEFASGQALGGHMRRHRSAATNTNTTSSDIIDAGEKTRNMLELDLNLPAPPEDDRREMKFHRFTPNKQPRLVFSTAALVDCHY